ncbi:hypothetical protein Leryth_012150, partial [Lithospermum erythrorhizon]
SSSRVENQCDHSFFKFPCKFASVLVFFACPELNREFKKLASFPPGEIGCLEFFKSP